AGPQLRLRLLAESGHFVDVQTHTVAESVAEALALPLGRDDLARSRIYFSSRASGGHRRDAGQLCPQHQFVDLPRRLPGVAGGDRAGAVRAVAVELRAPIDHDEVPVADLDVTRHRVGPGPVGARGDDRLEA